MDSAIPSNSKQVQKRLLIPLMIIMIVMLSSFIRMMMGNMFELQNLSR